MRLLYTICLFLFGLSGFAQSAQSEFLEAKRLLRENQFKVAKSAFSSLKSDPVFGKHATFYSAYAAYQEGQKQEAAAIWEFLLKTSSDWDQIDEIHYWLARTHYEQSEVGEAIGYAELNKEDKASWPEEMAQTFLPSVDKTTLIALLDQYPTTIYLAEIVAKKLDPAIHEEAQLLERLIATFDLKKSDYSNAPVVQVKKEKYTIAVLFPFMFDSLQNPSRSMNNRLVMDMYQGMLVAQEKLKEKGVDLTLKPYDTKKDKKVTADILRNASLRDADLIIGPLFSGPSELVRDFAKENQINVINPVSSNGEIIQDNEYSFLLKPSYETIARALAAHAIDRFEDKRVLIYFSENKRDSIVAYQYHREMLKAGFEVEDFRQVDNLASKRILDSLTDDHRHYFTTRSELDSVRQIPGRQIKSQVPRSGDKEQKRNAMLDSNRKPRVYFEKRLNIAEGAVARHIMVATNDNGIVNNFISLAETRPDTISLLGYDNWLDFKVIDFEQIQRLQVAFAFPGWIKKKTPVFLSVERELIEAHKGLPGDFSFLGYEAIMYLGSMMQKYGKYFQYGFQKEGFRSGELLGGFEYGVRNDNQYVPIVTFEHDQLKLFTTENDQ